MASSPRQPVDRTRGHSLRVCQESFRLDTRRSFFTEMIAKYWNCLLREELKLLSLQVFKKRLDAAHSALF